MYLNGKSVLKCYSLIFLVFLLIRTFYNSAIIGMKNKSLIDGVRNSVESALYIPMILYIANI